MPQADRAPRESLTENSRLERAKIRRALRLTAMALLFVAFTTLLVRIFLPVAAAGAVRNSFYEGLQAKTVWAKVDGGLGWKLFTGRSNGMEVWMEFDQDSALALTGLRATWGKSNVALSLIRQGRGGERDAEPTMTELHWDERSLATYLNRIQGEVLVSQVEITPEAVGIEGTIDFAGGSYRIKISGRPKTNDLGYLLFTAEQWQVESLDMTPLLQENLCAALSFQPDLAPLAWQVWPQAVRLEEGLLVVEGSNSCCR